VNKRLIAFLSILSLLLSLALTPVNAAAKAGSKCIKVGAKSVVNNKSYVCTKSGRKLIWLESKNKKSSPGLPGGFETNTIYSTILAMTINLFLPEVLIQELLLNGKRWNSNIK